MSDELRVDTQLIRGSGDEHLSQADRITELSRDMHARTGHLSFGRGRFARLGSALVELAEHVAEEVPQTLSKVVRSFGEGGHAVARHLEEAEEKLAREAARTGTAEAGALARGEQLAARAEASATEAHGVHTPALRDGEIAAERATAGRNEVHFLVDEEGRTRRVTGVLRETIPGARRSSAERAAQSQAAALGRPADVGGHVVGHRFLPGAGSRNLFPQDTIFNNRSYRVMENEMAAWTKHGMEVHFNTRLLPPGAVRPDRVTVEYEVVDPSDGRLVFSNEARFRNTATATFTRTPTTAMSGLIRGSTP